TSWDDLGRLQTSQTSPPYQTVSDSASHFAKQTREKGTFQPRSRTFANVPNVPKPSLSTHLRKRPPTHRCQAQQPKRDVSTASSDVLPAFQNVTNRPEPPVQLMPEAARP